MSRKAAIRKARERIPISLSSSAERAAANLFLRQDGIYLSTVPYSFCLCRSFIALKLKSSLTNP